MSIMDRVTSVIADFGDPFYTEERQRDVWNEASAVGFQTVLWGGLVIAPLMVWTGGRAVATWAVVLLVLLAVASWLTTTHAKRLGVTGLEQARWKRPRVALAAVLYAVTVVGVVFRLHGSFDASTLAGVVAGAAVALGALWLTHRRSATA